MSNNILDYEFNLEEPHSRVEEILHNMIDSNYDLKDPQSRIEALLQFISENGIGSGSNVSYMTKEEWDDLSYDEKVLQGLTLIGDINTAIGTFYNLSVLEGPYKYNDDNENVLDILNSDGTFSFHGFYSNNSGDRCTAGGRGGTWDTNDLRFICNALYTNNYGCYFAFAKTADALAATNTQYYGIYQVDGFDMYVAGNIDGAWLNNNDVTFVHDGVSKSLQNMFSLDNYTIYGFTRENDKVIIPDRYFDLLSYIDKFLSNKS